MKAGRSGRRRAQTSRREMEAAESRAPPIPATELTMVLPVFICRDLVSRSILNVDSSCRRFGREPVPLQRSVNGFIAGDHLGELLRNLIAELLEFGDVDVLNSSSSAIRFRKSSPR